MTSLVLLGLALYRILLGVGLLLACMEALEGDYINKGQRP
jgi:hypothetical protein